ncbi:MAG: helix-turn-helix transcriptional regulator [Opitutales bacterium]|nr:helix-turn-helix transcriptional regulator [Opitutales bacterium]
MKRGYTQEQTAEWAGIALRTLQKIEAGQINILVTTARRLREAIGCTWKKLMD